MNIRLIIGLIFVIIILGGLGIFFMNEQNTRRLSERINPTGIKNADNEVKNVFPNGATVTTNDDRVSFQYPENWYEKDTTVPGKKGKFGSVVQALTLQNIPFPTVTGTISDDLAKIDIEIQSGGTNLSIDALVDCTMKTTICNTVGIDSEQFIRADTTLNTGMKTIALGTFYDDKVLIVNALITPGDQEETLTKNVNDIINSIKFSQQPSGKD